MKKFLLTLFTVSLAATTLFAVPQAIVFDFGGVLTNKPNREAVVQFIQKSFNLSNEEFEKLNQEKRIALKQGKTDEEFWLSYAKTRGITLPNDWVQSLKSVMKEAIAINPQMYAMIEELREQQIPVAMLSNIDDRFAKIIREFGFYKPFKPCLLSCEIGFEKPDPKAYELLLEAIQFPAEEVVFIDDKATNVDAAKKLGIDAIVFESEKQIRDELNKRGFFLK